MTPGIRTSEFWLTIASMVALVVLAVVEPGLRDQAFYAVAAVVAGYTASRGLTKAGASRTDGP